MENVIEAWVRERGRLHFTLIDPDKQSPGEAAELARKCESFGSDALMIGGSTINKEVTDKTAKAIGDAVSIPIILFPNSANAVSRHADYVFFMSLLNSRKREFLVGEQVKAAPYLKDFSVKPIPMGYLVVSTSSEPTTVERVSDPDPITEKDVGKCVAYALTAQYFGMDCVYLEAGSGAEKPVPSEMVSAVKKSLDIPVIVGGGIRSPKQADAVVEAGADVVVTGTIVERDPSMQERIIKAVKKR